MCIDLTSVRICLQFTVEILTCREKHLNMEEDKMDILESEQIKSTAIVKYSLPKPAQFMKLQCNTDLNMPPSNWLSSSADSYGLQHVLSHPKGFSR